MDKIKINTLCSEEFANLFLPRVDTGYRQSEMFEELLHRLDKGRRAILAMEKFEELSSRISPIACIRPEYIEEACKWEQEYVDILADYEKEPK